VGEVLVLLLGVSIVLGRRVLGAGGLVVVSFKVGLDVG